MLDLETLTAVLGWSSVINLVVLMLSTLVVITLRGTIARLHASLFGLNEQDLGRAYFQYLAQFKIAIIVFNVAPYLALRIVA